MPILEPSFESQKRHNEFIAHLTSCKGYVPLKFAYGGSAATTHDNAAKSAQYKSITSNVDFEVRQLLKFVPNEALTQICDIGPGNGVHTAAVMRGLAASGKNPHRYLALDFNSGMLDLTQVALESEFSLDVGRAIWDVELGPTSAVETWRSGAAPVLALFLGLTFGNVESPGGVLASIRTSMRLGDVMAIGIALWTDTQDREAVLSPYRTAQFRTAVLEPFRAVGIPDRIIDLSLELHGAKIEAFAVPEATIDIDGNQILAGSRIRCFLSRRFDHIELENLLEANNYKRISPVKSGSEAHSELIVVEAV